MPTVEISNTFQQVCAQYKTITAVFTEKQAELHHAHTVMREADVEADTIEAGLMAALIAGTLTEPMAPLEKWAAARQKTARLQEFYDAVRKSTGGVRRERNRLKEAAQKLFMQDVLGDAPEPDSEDCAEDCAEDG